MLISLDTDKLATLSKQGDKIVFSKDGEQVLIELYELSDMVEAAIKAAKKSIEETAIKLDPNFVSVQGDKVKVSYRAYGARYRIDESNLSQLPEKFYKTKISYSPEVTEVEKFIDEHGAPPLGILESDRTKQIQVRIKGKNDKKEE